MQLNTLGKLRLPVWVAVVAILGASLLPVGTPVAGSQEKSIPCAHSSLDGDSRTAYSGDDIGCFCGFWDVRS